MRATLRGKFDRCFWSGGKQVGNVKLHCRMDRLGRDDAGIDVFEGSLRHDRVSSSGYTRDRAIGGGGFCGSIAADAVCVSPADLLMEFGDSRGNVEKSDFLGEWRLAVDGVSREPLSRSNSLLTGNLTGKS